ncbi:hypothetical protein [Streptomyces sp. KL116D]|uniref:hypothetical protein n=1 Tax=Streptomyces sp. KL116D TaxID=3045152 RepID=UPI003558E014
MTRYDTYPRGPSSPHSPSLAALAAVLVPAATAAHAAPPVTAHLTFDDGTADHFTTVEADPRTTTA